jgi:hypothetical protein
MEQVDTAKVVALLNRILKPSSPELYATRTTRYSSLGMAGFLLSPGCVSRQKSLYCTRNKPVS